MALIDNLVSYWKLDESSDGSGAVTRVDSHGSNDLTDNNTTASAAGKISNGADFESGNSEYLSITDATQSGLDITGDFSFSLWFNFETTGFASFIEKYNANTDPDRSYIFYYDGGGLLSLLLSESGGGGTGSNVSWTPSTATWYHLVITGDFSANEFKFYVNGSQQGTTRTNAAGAIYNGVAPFLIGKFSTLYADGIQDEVGVWSRALTSDEVIELYNSGAGLAYPFSATTNSNFFLVM